MKLSYAVIGIGRMGGIHANNLAKGRDKNANLVAVCDLDTEKLAKFKSKFPNVITFTIYQLVPFPTIPNLHNLMHFL
jgi:predicted dehydrogenase